MLINYVPGEECRVAVVSEGRLEELHHERANGSSLVGNIYVGKVMNVEPSIQAAFVDFGIGNNGFLHVSDVHPQYFPGEDDETTERIGKKTPRRERPPIQACLKRGQEILVQVLKEGISTKGPTLTSYLSIPGRYLVMLPQMDKSGVSKKVEDEDARKEMKAILDQLELPEGFGFIVRTAGIGRNKTDLKRDLAYLQRLWTDIEKRRSIGNGPRLLYAESDLLMRALRDIWNSEIGEIVIDNESAIRRAARFMKIVSPRGTTRLLHHNLGTPMFHSFGIEEQIERIHAREVPLPSGGYLVIDEAEALVAIDVNSGKSRESRDSETNAFRTNQEAVDEICRQLKLRDVGGLVLCDLIDMANRKNRKDIEGQFKERLKRDRAATRTLPVSEFGIVEMTRQRMKGSFLSQHFAGCPHCQGRGKLRRPDSVSGDAMRELQALLDRPQVAKVEMVVSARMAGELLSNKRQAISRLEFHSNKHVDVRVSDAVPVDRVSFYAYDGSGADIELEKLNKPKPPRDLPEWKYATATASDENDWSVDTSREHADLPPELVSEPQAEELDLISDEGESDDQGWVSERSATNGQADSGEGQGEGGRRKRRRRRRGRGGRADGAENAQPQTQDRNQGNQPARQPAPRPQPQGSPQQRGASGHDPALPKPAPSGGFGSWDVAPGEPVPARGGGSGEPRDGDDQGAPGVPMQRDETQAGEQGTGGRKRRRRRRGRGRGPSGQDGAPASQTASSGENQLFDGDAPEPDSDDSRGDSWDQAPAPSRSAATASAARSDRGGQQQKAAPQVKMVLKRRVKLDEFFRPVVDEQGEPVFEEVYEPVAVAAVSDDAPPPSDMPSSELSDMSSDIDADAGESGDDDSDLDESADGGQSGGAAPSSTDGTGKKKRRRRRRRGGRGNGEGSPDGAPRPNTPAANDGRVQGKDARGDRHAEPRGQRDNPAPGPRPAARIDTPPAGESRRQERRPPAPADVKSRAGVKPPAIVTPPPSATAPAPGTKPVRPLYGAGRARISASKAASAAKSNRD